MLKKKGSFNESGKCILTAMFHGEEGGDQAVEAAKKAVSQSDNIPITQLLAVMGSPEGDLVNVFMLKEELVAGS